MDGYTLKEMLQEVREQNNTLLVTQAKILTTQEGVEKHLAALNSKVATHEKKIGSLEGFQTKAMVVWSFVIFVAVTFTQKVLANINL